MCIIIISYPSTFSYIIYRPVLLAILAMYIHAHYYLDKFLMPQFIKAYAHDYGFVLIIALRRIRNYLMTINVKTIPRTEI